MKVRVPIEVDITYTNKTWFSLKKKISNEKHYVIGFYQRGIKGQVNGIAIIKALPDNKSETIEKVVLENISKGCMLYAHENILPASLKNVYEISELKVSEGQFTNGDIHINNVNNMWRDLKRLIKREHIHVSKKHLQLYCSEVAWRINHSHLNTQGRFEALMSNLSVKPEKRSYQDFTK